jgi:hypothetical protein
MDHCGPHDLVYAPHNVEIFKLLPNCTYLHQPMDAGIESRFSIFFYFFLTCIPRFHRLLTVHMHTASTQMRTAYLTAATGFLRAVRAGRPAAASAVTKPGRLAGAVVC